MLHPYILIGVGLFVTTATAIVFMTIGYMRSSLATVTSVEQMDKFSTLIIALGPVTALVALVYIAVVANNRRPDTAKGVLRFAGLSSRMVREMKESGIDIKAVSDHWKLAHVETGVTTWTRFGRPSMWRRKLAVSTHVALLSSDKSESVYVAALHLLGVSDQDIRDNSAREMYRLYTQGVSLDSLAYAAENDIDADLFKNFTRNNDMMDMQMQMNLLGMAA